MSDCHKYDINVEKTQEKYTGKDVLDKFTPTTNSSVVNTCSDRKDHLLVITSGEEGLQNDLTLEF